MRKSIEIGCPMGQAAWANFALKISLLLLATFFIVVHLPAQCNSTTRGIHEFTVYSDCYRDDPGEHTQVIEFKIAGTINASEIVMVLESDETMSEIDSIQVEWVSPAANWMPSSQLSWAQEDNRKRLKMNLRWDPCNPVFQNLFHFRLKAFCATEPIHPWRFNRLDGGIVQVDVIQAKTSGTETQRLYNINGVTVREVDRPTQSPPATEGLNPGIYLLQRVSEGKVTSCEKILVL